MNSSGYNGYSQGFYTGTVVVDYDNIGICTPVNTCITSTAKVEPFKPEKRVFEKNELTMVGIAVPGAIGKDLAVWVEKGEVVVSYTERYADNMEEENKFMENFTVTIPLKIYHNVKKITSKLERGVLWVYIPHKPEHDKDIEISE